MTQPFFVVVPEEVNDSNFVSSTVPENDYPVYDAGVTYNTGDRVILTTGYHQIYESLVDSNLGNFPPNSPLSWVLVGPTNAWALFDESGNTITTGTSPIEFVINGDRITDFGFQEVIGTSIRIRAFNVTEGTYYDQTFILNDFAVVNNWYDYFFEPINRKTELIVRGIPPIGDSQYTITINGDGTSSIGTYVMGQATEFGNTQYGARAGIIDYSRKEVDQFGRATLLQRSFSKRMEVTLFIDNDIIDSVYRKLINLRATPNLWVGANESFETLSIYGFYRDFSVDIAYPQKSLCTLTIEGLN